ncbi:MAG: hypothetical protein CFE45_30045, partial [Burkholderiales bacterium PBB5]
MVTGSASRIDLSGGLVNYTADTVKPSWLISEDGSRYSLNTATADLRYTALQNNGATVRNRWQDVVARYGANPQGQLEAGYSEGRAAGALTVLAQQALLDGRIDALSAVGRRQVEGLDALASRAAVSLTLTSPVADGLATQAGDLRLAREVAGLGARYWAPLAEPEVDDAALQAVLTGLGSRVAAPTLQAANPGRLTLSTTGGLLSESGAALALGPRATISLTAQGSGGLRLGGDLASAGGTLAVRATDGAAGSAVGVTVAGPLTVDASVQLDVSGTWVNQQGLAAGQPVPAAALGGGNVTLQASHGLVLQTGSHIDVSGGATVRANGAISGTSAGRIVAEGNLGVSTVGEPLAPFQLGASLAGWALNGGGSLRLRAGELLITAA